ncbi:diadenylate cyclase CdaA [bacterium]|nr:diadenylate cyclase CdaA [bacterium]
MGKILSFAQNLWQGYLVNILDIIIVGYIFYRILLLIKGTRAFQVLRGILILVGITVIADSLHFTVLSWLLTRFWLAGVIALVIVFQPELRRVLAQLGGSRLSRIFLKDDVAFVEEIIKSIKAIISRDWGALIVLEQQTGLKNFVETGVIINGEISKELICSVFNPDSPLHDGAVIIRNDQIIAAGCILPLSQERNISRILGTRHRAGVGLTEVSDAWVIMVSEETRLVSLAREGRLERGIEIDELKKLLRQNYKSRYREYPFLKKVI